MYSTHSGNAADRAVPIGDASHDDICSEGAPQQSGLRGSWAHRAVERFRVLRDDEQGAVTAEYALVIMAGVAFAGLLIIIMRSEEVRSMLVSLVQNALGSAG